jgi:hypothetical protein
MSNIKLKIVGRAVGADAPTVDDLANQVRDFFDILTGVEEALAPDGRPEVQWRIVNASKASPLSFEAAPFSRQQYGVNVDRIAAQVVRATAIGLLRLHTRGARPEYFSDKILRKAYNLFARVSDGLGETIVEYGEQFPVLNLTRMSARSAASFVHDILQRPSGLLPNGQ